MSGGYNNQQGYGNHQHHHESSDQPQYLQQNYGYQNQGFVPAYQNNIGFAPAVSDEYLRQPATAPYPTAHMPEPPPVMHMTEPPINTTQQPSVIIVQHPTSQQNDDCCTLANSMCRCIDWLLTRICYVILTLILIGILLGLGIWLIHKYYKHY